VFLIVLDLIIGKQVTMGLIKEKIAITIKEYKELLKTLKDKAKEDEKEVPVLKNRELTLITEEKMQGFYFIEKDVLYFREEIAPYRKVKVNYPGSKQTKVSIDSPLPKPKSSKRLALRTLRKNGYCLEDIEIQNRKYPDSFHIPEREQRENVKYNDVVKLVFNIKDPATTRVVTERMWVVAKEKSHGFYIGELNNTPCTERGNLRLGSKVIFRAEHIVAFWKG
jgi:hypothetical protein